MQVQCDAQKSTRTRTILLRFLWREGREGGATRVQIYKREKKKTYLAVVGGFPKRPRRREQHQ